MERIENVTDKELQNAFRWLKEHNVYHRWMHNFLNSKNSMYRIGQINELIAAAFDWRNTPEGFKFWAGVSIAYSKSLGGHSVILSQYLTNFLGEEPLLQECFPELVNYPHLKEGASSFNDEACIKVSLNVEVSSPEA